MSSHKMNILSKQSTVFIMTMTHKHITDTNTHYMHKLFKLKRKLVKVI